MMNPGHHEGISQKRHRMQTASALLGLLGSLALQAEARLYDSIANPAYSFEGVDVPGSVVTVPKSINASGQVTGNYQDAKGTHGFVYSAGTFSTLDVAGATSTYPMSINDSGQVAGNYVNETAGSHGFVYSDGTYTILKVPGAIRTSVKSINNSGQVTGNSYDSNGIHGFIYSGGTYAIIDVPAGSHTYAGTYPVTINDHGHIAGYYVDDQAPKTPGFIYSDGAYTTLDAFSGTCCPRPVALNNYGQVAGHGVENGPSHGFIYSGGTYTTLDVAGSIGTVPTSINESGQVTGHYQDSNGTHGFVYSAGIYAILDFPGAAPTYPVSINDSGQVAGYYWVAGYYRDGKGPAHGFIATPSLPSPVIKANLSDGPISVATGEIVSIAVALNGAKDQNADWWLAANTEAGDWYYYVYPGQWIFAGPDLENMSFAYQGPLFTLNPFEALKTNTLSQGKYKVYFGVDLKMNGLLDMDEMFYDGVEIDVQ